MVHVHFPALPITIIRAKRQTDAHWSQPKVNGNGSMVGGLPLAALGTGSCSMIMSNTCPNAASL